MDRDLYDTLLRLRPTPAPRDGMLDGARERLEAECRDAVVARGSRRARRWAVPLAAATFLAGAGAAAWAVTWSDPATSTTFECGADTYIPVESGNPVADCHAALARQEAVVPPLQGWLTSGGLVAVLPKGEAPPAGSTPLPSGFAVDRSVLYVSDVLADEAQPMATSCTTSATAAAFTRSELALADLVGWSVQVRASSGASGACVGYSGYLEPSSRTAVLAPIAVTSASSVDAQLDERLRAQPASGTSRAVTPRHRRRTS